MDLYSIFDFVEVCSIDDLPAGKGSLFVINDKNVAIYNVNGKIYAMADACPHAGASLGMGKLSGNIVTCPAHAMKFDVTNGCFANTSNEGVLTYPAKVANGKIMVSLPLPGKEAHQ